jgi:hypothetical protein
MSLAYLRTKLSGGAANADASLSIGGVKSVIDLSSLTYSRPPSSKISVTRITGTGVADITLSLNGGGGAQATASSGGVTVNLTMGQGTKDYVMELPTNKVYFTMTSAFNDFDNFTYNLTALAQPVENLFDNLTGAEVSGNSTDYRCIYLENNHATEEYTAVEISMSLQPTDAYEGFYTFGEGTSNGTGTEPAIADDATAPTGVSFTQPLTLTSPIAPGQHKAIWIKRFSVAGTPVATAAVSQAQISIKGTLQADSA